MRRFRAVAGVSSNVTGGRSVLTSAAVLEVTPPQAESLGLRPIRPTPRREVKKKSLQQFGLEKQKSSYRSFRLQ